MRLSSAATLVVLVILLLLAFVVGRGTRGSSGQHEVTQVDSTGEQAVSRRRNTTGGRSGASGRVGPLPLPQTACGGAGVGGASRYFCPGGESEGEEPTDPPTRFQVPGRRTP
jgi:hypothetical protein